MKITELSSMPNLRLAWRRITTGGNYQYKRFFRNLYYAYEVALEDNLKDLQQRLRGGAFEASTPERIYFPKSSGLHRPLALLRMEDQIVLQAFANLAAKKLQKRRVPLQFRVVFSNLLQTPNSIFFFRQWQQTYGAFQRTIRKHYNSGLRWVADFDLAAFYDTISHSLLVKTIYPLSYGDDINWFIGCLQTWSSAKLSSEHGHGIPQGPLASDFLAECYLLPLDNAMKVHKGYIRYVDDVRLLGKSENEVRQRIIELEQHCRERGLIPQTGKFAVKHAMHVDEAMGKLPSFADPQREAGTEEMPKTLARAWFYSALDGKPYRVKDKTRLRYVLFRAQPDWRVLQRVLHLIPHHPEHTDAFFTFINRFGYSKPVERLSIDLIQRNPYPYVRGEAWYVLARYRLLQGKLSPITIAQLTRRAMDVAKKTTGNFMEKWGVLHFLCASEKMTGNRYSRFLMYQPALLQSSLSHVLPSSAFQTDGVAKSFLRRSSIEPGLSICSSLHSLEVGPTNFRIQTSDLPSQVRNTLCELGVISIGGVQIDPIAEILERRYGLARGRSWRLLLGIEYIHALGLLKQAEAAFFSGMSFWLACQNSFNHAIFVALQKYLNANGIVGACSYIGGNGQLVDFGTMLDTPGPFSRHYPSIGGCFRDMNTRRNRLPVSHPYEKKTGIQTKHLKVQERNKFVNQLRTAYQEFTRLMP